MVEKTIELIKEVIREYPTPEENYIFILEYNEKKDEYRTKIVRGDGSVYSEGLWEKRGNSLGPFWLPQGSDSIKDKIGIIEDTGKINVLIEKAIREFCSKDIIKNVDWNKEIEKNKKNRPLPQIFLPIDGKLISHFAEEVAKVLGEKKNLFFRPQSKDIIEIADIKEEDTNEEYIGFSSLRADRFITVAEKYFIPCIEVKTRQGTYVNYKSMSTHLAAALLASPQLQNALPKIKRIFNTPIPILYEGKLCFPKKGYDERFYSWMPFDAPSIDDNISLEQAKQIINDLYSEFCFQERQDYINTIAGLLTPFLKGLFPSFSTRVPVFFYMANRERAGKDYCANITGIVHEGHAIQEPPICNGDKGGNNNDELKKKVLSAMIAGKKRLHFANNRGYIDNAVFEAIITAEKWSDRILGRNEEITLDNEIDFSLSGNVGVGFTADLANRSRFIRLFLEVEDANSRQFKNPDLHKWVKDSRSLILSALYALVKNWVEKGMPKGSVPFSSYPEWADICGGVMEAAGYDSPCNRDRETLSLGGDVETADMKTLFEMCYDAFPNEWVTKHDIRNLVMRSEDSIFAYLDFNKKSDQTKFGLKVTKFVGRVLSDITLKLRDPSVRSSRQQFMFTKDKVEQDKSKIFGKVVTLVTFGNLTDPKTLLKTKSNEGVNSLPMLPTLPTSDDFNKLKEEYEKEGLI